MLKVLAFITTCFFFIGVTNAQTINQNRKKLDVIRVDVPPKIDGKLDDAA